MSIKKYFIISVFIVHSIIAREQPFTIMIDPCGDSKHTGREIDDTFERGITLQCAEELKKQLISLCPQIRVVLTRVPGETIQPLQNASFANRLQVDFYLSIAFYQEEEIPPHISIFYYKEGSLDHLHLYKPFHFYHIEQAHLINFQITQTLGKLFLDQLKNNSINSVFNVQGLFAIPCKPLIGIKAPALFIEAGLAKKNDWKYLVNMLTTCLKSIIP